jgi:dTDP-4-amino-4,6-dideoxygalactose transaminase
LLKNFGIGEEESTIGLGINGKMTEFQAAFGLLQLELVEREIAARRRLAIHYREQLQAIPGIRALDELADTEDNYAYFPVIVDDGAYGLTRDQLAVLLGRCNVMARKYFYPLLSRAACYASLPSATPAHLPVAERVASRILCLPIYGALPLESVSAICNAIREAPELSHG